MGANFGCQPASVDNEIFKNFCLSKASAEYQKYLSKAFQAKYLYNEDIIFGDWPQTKPKTGKGIIYSPQKFYYQGDIVESRAEGIGKIIWPIKAIYNGSIIGNKANGQGQLTFGEGEFSLKGLWKNGEPLENSKMLMTSKEQKSYVTIIEMNLRKNSIEEAESGGLKVKMEFGEGVIYDGEVKQKKDCVFKFEGRGRLTFSDGSRYEGQFVNGKMHGYGQYYWANNQHWYKGQYKNNLRDGKGIYYYNNSIYKEGIWKGGMLISGQAK